MGPDCSPRLSRAPASPVLSGTRLPLSTHMCAPPARGWLQSHRSVWKDGALPVAGTQKAQAGAWAAGTEHDREFQGRNPVALFQPFPHAHLTVLESAGTPGACMLWWKSNNNNDYYYYTDSVPVQTYFPQLSIFRLAVGFMAQMGHFERESECF